MTVIASPLQVAQTILHNSGRCDRVTCTHCASFTPVDITSLLVFLRSFPSYEVRRLRKRHFKRSSRNVTKPRLPMRAREQLKRRELPPYNPEHFNLTAWEKRRWDELVLLAMG